VGQLNASVEGFRLVLIGDIHELPLVHFESKAFDVRVKDWSGEVNASGTCDDYC
jgi:vacuolar protein sorting-associated protein 13A/C